MKHQSYFDLRKIAERSGGVYGAKEAFEQQIAERERMLRVAGLDRAADMARVLGGTSYAEQLLQDAMNDPLRDMLEHASCYTQLVDAGGWAQRAESVALGSIIESVESVRLAGGLDLPVVLDPYRVTDGSLARQIAHAQRLSWWEDSLAEALNAHSALSGMFDGIDVVGREAQAAIDSVLSDPLIDLYSVRQAREMLSISGLLRFPRFRTLTVKEKKQRIKRLIKDNAEPAPVRKAKGLVHRYEKVLRTLIAQCMEDEYGEDWAHERLPECDCKKLLGRPLEGDESVLDHADYKHYELIMCHEEHYEAVFAIAYEDVNALRGMIVRLGQLRARSHHGRTFTAKDLRELATLWRAMEAGFESLIDDVVIDP